jgi:hypothetical protein
LKFIRGPANWQIFAQTVCRSSTTNHYSEGPRAQNSMQKAVASRHYDADTTSHDEHVCKLVAMGLALLSPMLMRLQLYLASGTAQHESVLTFLNECITLAWTDDN